MRSALKIILPCDEDDDEQVHTTSAAGGGPAGLVGSTGLGDPTRTTGVGPAWATKKVVVATSTTRYMHIDETLHC